jgi:DNA-binding transcriptional ArsR family regulator
MARTAASTRSNQTPGAKRLADIRRVADLLKRVSDPTRVQVLLLLNEQERKVSELCSILGTQSPPALSHHLSLLRHGHLIEPIRTGKFLVYRLTEAGESLVNVIEEVVE